MAQIAQIRKQLETIGRIIAVLVLLALTLTQLVTKDAVARADAFDVSAELAAAEVEAVDSSRLLFKDAGFPLPDVIIEFHANTAECRGQAGRYEKLADRTATVDVCYDRHNPDVGHIQRARVLWHELAHAYLEPRVDEATKQTLLNLLGVERWNGGEWSERGGDFAVEILLWGIKDGQYRLHPNLRDLDCETKAAGYMILTGLGAPACSDQGGT